MLPRRILGHTGMEVSLLAFGSGSFFQKLPEGQWEPLVQKALDLGITFYDTADVYGDEPVWLAESLAGMDLDIADLA